MITKKGFSWRARARSFKYAIAGLKVLLGEHNAWIHCCAAVAVTVAGGLLGISRSEWLAVVLCIGAVLSLEAVNTAVEAICDHVSPQFAPLVKRAKDVAAAAVLIMALAAVVAGCIIFMPRIFAPH